MTLNLADFGAAGNGQADDTAALRNAVSAVLEAGGGTVYLPAGTYRLTDTLMLTGDDSAPLTLRADPTGQTVLVADASVNGPAVWIERSGVTLFGLDIILGTTEDQPSRAGDGQPCHAGFGHGTHDGRQHAARLSGVRLL